MRLSHLTRKGAAGIDLAMTGGEQDDAKTASEAKTRRHRLSEALRANLAKRKAQARARREAAITRGDDRQKPEEDRD
ncbi:MAG TPA: hypothetical protein VFK91_04305 [Methyloceanibacter sp.]|nr:hypothetical protein [Methyloceanibacter sp.]